MEQPGYPKENQNLMMCQWRDCNQKFSGHPLLATHLSDDHVGWKKGDYFCEWTNCARKGAKCHNRFALMMHLRIHTGEKPFECTFSDCGQTFGRMDALTRHKKAEHGEETSIPNNNVSSTSKLKRTKRSVSDTLSKKPKKMFEKYPSYHSSDNNESIDDEISLEFSKDTQPSKLSLDVSSDYNQYRIAKAQLGYLLRENDMLQEEYEFTQKKIKRLKTEREVLLESVMLYDQDE